MEKDLHLATSVPAVFSPPTCSLIWHKSICLDTYLFCILHPQKYRETIRRHFTFLWTSTPHVLVSDCRLQSTCSYWRCRKTSTSNLTALCLAYSPCEFQYSGSPVKIMFSDGGWLLKGAPFTAVGAYFIQEHCAHKLLPLEPKVASLLLYLRNLLPRCAWRLRMHQICSTVICFPYGNHSIVLMHPSYKQLCSARGQNSFFMSCYKGYGNSQFSLFLHSENLLRGTQKQSCRYCVGVIPVWLMKYHKPWEKPYLTQISWSTLTVWSCLQETSQGPLQPDVEQFCTSALKNWGCDTKPLMSELCWDPGVY